MPFLTWSVCPLLAVHWRVSDPLRTMRWEQRLKAPDGRARTPRPELGHCPGVGHILLAMWFIGPTVLFFSETEFHVKFYKLCYFNTTFLWGEKSEDITSLKLGSPMATISDAQGSPLRPCTQAPRCTAASP